MLRGHCLCESVQWQGTIEWKPCNGEMINEFKKEVLIKFGLPVTNDGIVLVLSHIFQYTNTHMYFRLQAHLCVSRY